MARKAIWFLLVCGMVFALVSCGRPSVTPRRVYIFENAGTGEEVVLENEYLHLRFLPETAEIILTDRATGVEWRSNPAGRDYDEGTDFVTRQLINSQFSLLYADVSGIGMTLFSSQHSVEHGAFSYAVVDGTLEVRYTVGNLTRIFRIPPAMEEDRMVALLDRVLPQYRGRIRAAYRLFDLDNLLPADDRTTLLYRFPELSRTNIFVLQDTTQEFLKEQIEGFLADAGYTYDEWRADVARFPAVSPPERPTFNITLRYTLDGRSLVVNVPFDEIAFRQSYPITMFSLLPFMGAGGLNDEGYLFVPDGSGAIIDFNNGRHTQQPFFSRVYGWNEAMPRDALILDNRAPFPVFGVQKNGAALVGIIEEGSAYAGIRADVSRRNSSFNIVHPVFDMIHGAVMDISGRSDRLVFLYERELPAGESITVRFIPTARDGYVGMAKEYRNWLLQRYPVLRERVAAGRNRAGVPVAVEIIGAISKTQHRLGIPFDLPLRLTSYYEAEGMLRHFADLGWRDVHVKLTGWFNRSVEHAVPSRIRLINELGNTRSFKGLISSADELGFEIYPGVDFFFMRNSRAFDGFSSIRDVARHPNRERVQQYPFSFVWFGERTDWGTRAYLARPEFSMNLIGGFVERAYDDFGLRNVAFKSMGSRLGGDFHERRTVSREAAMRMRQAKLCTLNDSGIGVMMRTGFSYTVPWANIIIDIPLEDQGANIINTSVPFYQIALRGLVPYTGRAINLAEDFTQNLLRIVETGAGLHFSFMMESAAALQETRYRQFFANDYARWIDAADALYQRFTADFGDLFDQLIVDHVILSPGVTITVYEGGARVFVNRTEAPWNYG
ncbi:MAG: DUF5696 domain-containing protein, partial [Treponema sp.]|nr:DUF5696 domain-containing protein [Treponema sp.]